MDMYDKNVDTDNYNVFLDGYQMIMETVTSNEAFNRRETVRHNILGGTQSVMRGSYLVRDYNFTTHLLIDPDHPDVYDDIFREWQSKPVEVVSKYMGGKFNAEVIIKRSTEGSPNYLGLDVQVIEIPDSTSLIPHEEFLVPEDAVPKTTTTSTGDTTTTKNSTTSLTSLLRSSGTLSGFSSSTTGTLNGFSGTTSLLGNLRASVVTSGSSNSLSSNYSALLSRFKGSNITTVKRDG